MGIKKKLVQSLLFNSISQNNFGLILQNNLFGKADAVIFDHMLVMHSMCFVPISPGMDAREHIITNTLNFYTRYSKTIATSSTLFILCEDGLQSVKPAVRDKRNEHVPTAALVYFKHHKAELAKALVEKMQMEGICTLFITGYNGRSMSYQYMNGTGKRPAVPAELAMDRFIADCKEVEADMMMYAMAAHYSRRYPGHLVVITTRDTDVVPSGLALLADKGPEYLGNTVIEFKTPMFNGLKDHDRAVSDFLHVSNPTNSHKLILNRFAQFTPQRFFKADGFGGGTIEGGLFNLLFDSTNISPFAALIDKFVQTTASLDAEELLGIIRFFIACLRAGFRGTIFRRIFMRYLDDDPSTRETVTKFMGAMDTAADKYALLGDFLSQTNSYIANRTIKQLSPDYDWDIIDDADQSDGLGNCTLGQPYMVTTTSLSNRCIKGLVSLAKMYNDHKLPLDSYGSYIRMQTTHGHCYVRFAPVKASTAAVVACTLAGADYNLTIPKLGSVQIMNLLLNPDFIEMCEKTRFSVEEHGAEFIWKMISMTKLRKKTPVDPGLDEYIDCVWRTLCYTIQTWQLKTPVAGPDYGFTVRDSMVYFVIDDPSAFKNLFTLGRK
ncbi:ORF54 [Ictalurid herpesvirus 1]|nr:ORF54 [Ictalurid herpesvirus 1]